MSSKCLSERALVEGRDERPQAFVDQGGAKGWLGREAAQELGLDGAGGMLVNASRSLDAKACVRSPHRSSDR
ncbi:MAG: hypothetical protein LBM75_04650 [Myxococcales bacterium]|nr:hypothetical protein [Myxococcales bacterium]